MDKLTLEFPDNRVIKHYDPPDELIQLKNYAKSVLGNKGPADNIAVYSKENLRAVES